MQRLQHVISISNTVAFLGIEPRIIEVQVQIAPGLPTFQLVGLPNKTIAESKERIRATFHSIGLALPPKRIIVNLAPADLPKEGSHYDLPIALGLLMSLNILSKDRCMAYLSMGELGLDGKLTIGYGVLPTAMAAKNLNKGLICPFHNAHEAKLSGNLNLICPQSLFDLIGYLKDGTPLTISEIDQNLTTAPSPSSLSTLYDHQSMGDMGDVLGQAYGKRAIEIAAAGGHNLLMIGPPGAGKSMLASRLPSILPLLTTQQALETTGIHSLAGMLQTSNLLNTAPFRAPHHSASLPALVGGGARSKPGEISLAHNGVLFLDEIAEFSRIALEALRQPLEANTITISRANHHITYPARFQLIAAMNPCRCGFFGDVKRACHRAPVCAQDYQMKLSGPLMDRFDLVVYISATNFKDLQHKGVATKDSKSMAIEVNQAHQRQYVRTTQWSESPRLNAHLSPSILRESQRLSTECYPLLEKAYSRYKLSARSYHRLLKVSQTIADLVEEDIITPHHITQALQFRLLSPSD